MTPSTWILTFLIHSTVLTGLSLLVMRVVRGPAGRTLVLRGALLGGLITTSIAGLSQGGETWILPSTGGPRGIISLDAAAVPEHAVPGQAAPAIPGVSTMATSEVPVASPALGWIWNWLPTGLAMIGGLGLLRLAMNERTARRLLGRRKRIASPELTRQAKALLMDHPLSHDLLLTSSANIQVPMALGRREIILPEIALAELSQPHLKALLAHELAHLVRRDPLWLGLARIAVAVTWFQPLLHLLMKRLEEQTELAADDWAAQRMGGGLDLALCLEQVGGWVTATRTPAGAVAMASSGSGLVGRVERLLKGSAEESRRTHFTVAATTMIALGVFACAGPTIQIDEAPQPQTTSQLKAHLAGAQPLDKAKFYAKTRISILVSNPGHKVSYRSAGHRFDNLADLGTWLKQEGQEEHDGHATLHPTAGVIYGDIVAVLDLMLEAGFTDVTFAGAFDDQGKPWATRFGENATVQTPETKTPTAPDPINTTKIHLNDQGLVTVYMNDDGNGHREIYMAGRKKFGAELFQVLREAGIDTPSGRLQLRVDTNTQFTHVQQVMELCATRELQISDIHVELTSDPNHLTDFSLPVDQEVPSELEELSSATGKRVSNTGAPAERTSLDVDVNMTTDGEILFAATGSPFPTTKPVNLSDNYPDQVAIDCEPDVPMGLLLPMLNRWNRQGVRLIFRAAAIADQGR